MNTQCRTKPTGELVGHESRLGAEKVSLGLATFSPIGARNEQVIIQICISC